ncbi:MAG: adenylate/guanylate cyclase domain-containing protein [Nitrososphaeraceae archaeon]|nr:adenylate/guanylate cyclase domain-containing protein [Nitrososphaeraceae archaeon]MBV9667409.1 adenylate/guanylate cyclase domain-containing protein [Nitrososphaeraceae archaeon]
MASHDDKSNNPTSTPSSYQRQTILSLYSSGIERDVICWQLDISQEEVDKVIEEEEGRRRKQQAADAKNPSEISSIGNSFYLDAIVNIDFAIGNAQTRMWKALKSGGAQFDISMEETDKILRKFSRSKVTFVILHIDLVGSTQLSMILPLDRLTTIIQTFTQEMSTVIALYGGYVLKYIGDAILAFFITNSSINSKDDIRQKQEQLYLPCINAVNCARSMIKVIQNGINPILNQYDYPDMSIRIGIDVGEIALIQYGWDIHTLGDKQIVKEPHHDILGYTVNVAIKMTRLAEPNGLVIGQSLYNILDEKQRSTFERLNISPDVWSYIDEKSGSIYQVYGSKEHK